MALPMRELRGLLERHSLGQLDADEEQLLRREARRLSRKLARLQAIDPEAFAQIELGDALLALSQPEVLSGSA